MDQRQYRYAIGATTPQLFNVTLAAANTEYTLSLPQNTRALQFQARTNVAIRYAFAVGRVAGPTAPYGTLKAGASYWKDNICSVGVLTLRFATAGANVVVEVEVWT